MAMGFSISWPGLFPPTIIGKRASAAANAVIRIGASRSFAPRMMKAGPNVSPSSFSRCR